MAAYSCFAGHKLINPHASKLASDYGAFEFK